MNPSDALKFLLIPLKQAGLTADLEEIDGEIQIMIKNSDGYIVGNIPLSETTTTDSN
jgi:hypothetical protein